MKLLFRLFILAVVVIILYSFFFGVLLFLNPVKVEYERVKSERFDVYTRDTLELAPFYYDVGTDMEEAEELTGLKFIEKPIIFVTQDSKEFGAFVPWITNSKDLGGVALPVGNVMYINIEKIRKDRLDERAFFRKQLIQTLIAQNSILLNTRNIVNQEWFVEGLATYFSPENSLSDLEFFQQYDEKDPGLERVSDNIFNNLSDDVRFNSTLYRLFIEYLIDVYGIDTFRIFTRKYVESPSNFRVVFNDVYEKKMILVVDDFLKNYNSLPQ